MKKTILIVFILAITARVNAQTTQEEYNYVTRGYKIDIETGHDIKNGYEMKDIDRVQQTTKSNSIGREAWLKRFSRKSTNATAAYLIIYQRAGQEKEYFCVPTLNSPKELHDAFFVSLSAYDFGAITEKLQLITFLLARSLKWEWVVKNVSRFFAEAWSVPATGGTLQLQ